MHTLIESAGAHRHFSARAHTRPACPGAALFDGLLILIAGVALITPGFLTDLLGLALLVPVVRRVIRRLLWRSVAAALGMERPIKSI